MVRMRTPRAALEELRQQDPNTGVSLNLIRRLMKTGAVPSIAVCNGRRKLVNFDALLSYLESPTEDKPTQQVRGIRPVPEGLRLIR